MTLNRIKLGHVVTFIKYLTSVVCLIFVVLNLLNFAELVQNKIMKSISKKIYQYAFSYAIYRYLL